MESAQRDPEELQLLLESFVAIASEREVPSIAEQAMDLARIQTRARYGAAAILDGEAIGVFVHRGLTSSQVRAMPHLPKGRGLLAAVLEQATPVRCDRIADHPSSVGFPLNHVPMDAFLGVPIRFDDDLLGGLYLSKGPGEGTFSETDEHFVAALARQTGTAIKAARLLEEEQHINEELRAADQLKTHFVAIASHEMRTPLSSILGFASTLTARWTELDDAEKLGQLGTIRAQAERLARLSNDLLTVSRLEAGALEIHRERFPLAARIRALVAGLDAVRSPIAVHCPDDLELIADPDLVDQMLENFVTNALKYGDAPIIIDARAAGGWIELSVSDGGPGVPDEFVPRLFEKFARADDVRTRASRGTGLGLSIVRGLAEAHGGEVFYRHDDGACFGVRLPGGVAAA